jgi:hypothetical protein
MQLRHKDVYKIPSLTRPPAKAGTVSTAAVFKNQKIDTSKDRSAQSIASTKKSAAKLNREERKEEEHPPALAFKGSVMSLSDGRALLTVCLRSKSRLPPSALRQHCH